MPEAPERFSRFYCIIVVGIAACGIYYSSTQNPETGPVVRISTGDVQGLVTTSRIGRRFNLFLGIPFAEPPIGKLRFDAPQPPKSWDGILKATAHGPECQGYDIFVRGRVQGEESCLFLNVYAPESSTRPLPVIVYIHGGGFLAGSSLGLDGKFFMDHDIVLVTIQYRLGIFGFFHTNDGVIQGNMGLKDQVLALKWVKENIGNFGGDPGQVTVMGDSAGGISAHLLMLSPMAKGLFHRAVTLGAVATSPIVQFDRDQSGLKDLVVDHFNCPKQSEQLLNCLQDIDAHALASFHSQFTTANGYDTTGLIGPTVEAMAGPDAFLAKHPSVLLEKGAIVNRVPWLVGGNKNEGLLLLGLLLRHVSMHDVMDDNKWDHNLQALLLFDNNQRPDVAMKVKRHFFPNLSNFSEWGPEEVKTRISAMVTETVFLKPLSESAKSHAKVAPVYIYSYTYKSFVTLFDLLVSSRSSFLSPEFAIGLKWVRDLFYTYVLRLPDGKLAASHNDDTLLMFPLISNLFVSWFDLEMSELLVKTYVDFASLEKPSFQGLEWPAVNPSSGKLQCMELNVGEPKILEDPFEARLKFWNKLGLSHA